MPVSNLAKKLKAAKPRKFTRDEPLWQGPQVDGVTQTILSRYIADKERARLFLIEGIRPVGEFSARVEYGNMWHECEAAHAANKPPATALLGYCQQLSRTYPTQGKEIEKWYQICKMQFPIYVSYWAKHKQVKQRTPCLQESEFKFDYRLPSDRVVRLRGKWDAVDVIGTKKEPAIWLQENKSKSDIDEQLIHRQLTFDLQTMMYLIALDESPHWPRPRNVPIVGVRYNLVRRPLAGGKHSIKQLSPTKKNPKGESLKDYYARLGGRIAADARHFFIRIESVVSPSDYTLFTTQCFHPLLENILDDYEWWSYCLYNERDTKDSCDVFNYKNRQILFPKHISRHYRVPYGVYNPLFEGKPTEMDEYLASGSMAGLELVENLFPELKAT